jgi:hypothetical protein
MLVDGYGIYMYFTRKAGFLKIFSRVRSTNDLFVCLFIAVWAIFQLSGGCHHYRWQDCKFRPMLSTHGFRQWGFLFVPHLLRHWTSVYTVSPEGPAPTSHSGIRTGDALCASESCLTSEINSIVIIKALDFLFISFSLLLEHVCFKYVRF